MRGTLKIAFAAQNIIIYLLATIKIPVRIGSVAVKHFSFGRFVIFLRWDKNWFISPKVIFAAKYNTSFYSNRKK